jgi:hypothetical protein
MALINFRNALTTGKRKPTAKDYVQSGLVAMWDGIENAGWGVHDASATTWKDLSGNGYDMDYETDVVIGADGVTSATASPFASAATTLDFLYKTMEIVLTIQTSSTSGQESLLFARKGTNTGCAMLVYGGSHAGASGSNNLIISPMVNKKAALLSTNWQSCLGKRIAVAMTSDVLSLTNMTKSFINGVETTPIPAIGNGYSANSARIGGQTSTSRTFTGGIIHAVRLYANEMTTSDLLANYAIDKARFGLP